MTTRKIIRRSSRPLSLAAVGHAGFIEQHDLWDAEQQAAADEVRAMVEAEGLEMVRVCYSDQHGQVKGKSLTVKDFFECLENGIGFNTGPISMDTSSTVFLPIFTADGGFGIKEMGGGTDIMVVPDPLTFRVLPWADKTGWVLSNLYTQSGAHVPFDTRYVYQQALEKLTAAGFDYVAGLEVEFYIFKIIDPKFELSQSGWPPDPPHVQAISHGYQYQNEFRIDEVGEIFEYLRPNLTGVGLPLRSMEDEWGPGQCEITFEPEVGLDAADSMLLFRTATKQLCRRRGYLATFMCKPGVPNCFTSGWHLHQSLRTIETGASSFADPSGAELLSATGKHFMGGLIEHANACTAFAIPTINGYKRMNDSPLAPNRALWSSHNRAAYLRVVGGGANPGTHLENRSGDPAANPYLFFASQILAGLDGIKNQSDPGEPRDNEPYAQVDVPRLPRSLMEGVKALDASALFREEMGEAFVNYYLTMKRFEIARFLSYVTDWEHTEYFEAF